MGSFENVNCLIFGTSGFSKELRNIMEEDNLKISGYVLNETYIQSEEFDGLKLYSYEKLQENFDKKNTCIYISVGYSNMNMNRKKIYDMCEQDGWDIGTYINSDVKNRASFVGKGTIVLDGSELRYMCKIGKCNIILAKSILSHECEIGDFNYFAGSVHIDGYSVVGDCNFLGTSCILTDGTHIGNSNLIGAGTCVSGRLENNMLVSSAKTRVNKADTRMMNMLLMGNRPRL